MTAVDQLPFETLDDPQHHTPNVEALIKQRGTEDEKRLIPRGTYESTLLEVNLVRRKDGGGFVVRMIARTNVRGVYLTAWRGLSTSPTDPYDLTDSQVKALRKFAEQMGIPTPAPAAAIVQALVAMQGSPVMAKVTHTPAGIQSSFSAPDGSPPSTTLSVNGQLVVVDSGGEAHEVTEQRARDAFDAHRNVVNGRHAARVGFITAAKGCHDLRESQGWLALGFESLNEYLAQPEVELARSEFYGLADIWQSYVLDGGAPLQLLEGAERSKLEVPLPALKQGLVGAEQAASDAGSLTRKELRERYRSLVGDDVDESTAEQESRQRDVEGDKPSARDDFDQPIIDDPDKGPFDADELLSWADRYGHPEEWAKKAQDLHGKVDGALKAQHEVEQRAQAWKADSMTHLASLEAREVEIVQLKAELEQAQALEIPEDLADAQEAARNVVRMLRRVLDEVGRPEQKRMGKELRFAVIAALETAESHGLGTR